MIIKIEWSKMKFAAALLSVASAAANDASVVNDNCQTKEGNVVCWESYISLQFNNVTNQLEVNPKSRKGSCGLQYETNESMVNSTCTISWKDMYITSKPSHLTLGNGAFVSAKNSASHHYRTITGFDGISGTVSAIASWDTSFYNEASWTAANTVNGSLVVSNTTEFNHQDCFTTGLNRWIEVSCVDNGEATTEPVIMITNNSPGAVNNFAIANYGKKDETLTASLGVPCDSFSITSPMGDVSPGSDFDCTFAITITDDAPQLLYFQATTTEQVDFFNVVIDLPRN